MYKVDLIVVYMYKQESTNFPEKGEVWNRGLFNLYRKYTENGKSESATGAQTLFFGLPPLTYPPIQERG